MKLNGRYLTDTKCENGNGTWRKLNEQYVCSCCGHIISNRYDRGAHAAIELKGEAFCYNCGAFNTAKEERANDEATMGGGVRLL